MSWMAATYLLINFDVPKEISFKKGFKGVIGDLLCLDTFVCIFQQWQSWLRGACTVPEPSIVREQIEPKCSFIPALTRLLPFYPGEHCLGHQNSDKAYEVFRANVVDPVRFSSIPVRAHVYIAGEYHLTTLFCFHFATALLPHQQSSGIGLDVRSSRFYDPASTCCLLLVLGSEQRTTARKLDGLDQQDGGLCCALPS
jgi:hypothetical protein